MAAIFCTWGQHEAKTLDPWSRLSPEAGPCWVPCVPLRSLPRGSSDFGPSHPWSPDGRGVSSCLSVFVDGPAPFNSFLSSSSPMRHEVLGLSPGNSAM